MEETQHAKKQVMLGAKNRALGGTWAKSKGQRARNRRMLRAAEAVQHDLKENDPDKAKPACQTICWRSMTVVHDMHGVCTLEKAWEPTWHQEW